MNNVEKKIKKIENESGSMSFSDHLEELRSRVLNSIYSVLICIFVTCFCKCSNENEWENGRL